MTSQSQVDSTFLSVLGLRHHSNIEFVRWHWPERRRIVLPSYYRLSVFSCGAPGVAAAATPTREKAWLFSPTSTD